MNKLAETIIRDIWTRSEGTYVFLPQAVYRGMWWEGPALSKDADFPASLSVPPGEGWDSYFSVLSFDAPVRKGENVSGNVGVMWLDLDYVPADQNVHVYLWDEVGFNPTYLWESSPGHYQAVWFTEPVPKEEWRALAKAFTDRIEGADPGGWHETKVLRVPGSINHKRGGVEGTVLILPPSRDILVDPWELARMSGPLTTGGGSLPMPQAVSNDDRLRLLIREWQRLPLGVQHWLTISEDQYPYYAPRDRSLLIRGLLVQMKEAGLSPATAYHLVQGRPFDKFVDRPQDLWNEVLKAFGVR